MRILPLAALLAALSGCVSGPPSGATEGATPEEAAGASWQRLYVFDGELGAAGDRVAFPFLVPEGAREVEALLTWSDATAQLAFGLMDAAGQDAAQGWNEGDGRAYVTTTHPVGPGEWSLEVWADRALMTSFAATLTVRSEAIPEGPITTTFVIPPRDPTRSLPPEARAGIPAVGARDYAEINLNMQPGDAFDFSWNATSEVYFNVHYHGADGTTERPIEERTTTLVGSFAANTTEVYALLWRNEGTSELEVNVDLDGTYRLHSMTRQS